MENLESAVPAKRNRKTKLISQLELKQQASGLLIRTRMNLYLQGFTITARVKLAAGTKRIATGREGETQVGFENIDFGSDGSDTVTIPIFALTSEAYPFQIWEGAPNEEGSTLLADVVYQKESIWNVYQEETYCPSKTLRGITQSILFFIRKYI